MPRIGDPYNNTTNGSVVQLWDYDEADPKDIQRMYRQVREFGADNKIAISVAWVNDASRGEDGDLRWYSASVKKVRDYNAGTLSREIRGTLNMLQQGGADSFGELVSDEATQDYNFLLVSFSVWPGQE